MSAEKSSETIFTATDLHQRCKQQGSGESNPYIGQTVRVVGQVVFAGPDVYGLPSVELGEGGGSEPQFICVLPFQDYLKLRKIKKSQQIIVTGKIVGLYNGHQIVMKNCSLSPVTRP